MKQLTYLDSVVTPFILAGGLGMRLRPVVRDRPKSLALVNGKPFLSYIFDQLLEAGLSYAVVCTGHQGELIQLEFGNSYRELKLDYSRETSPLGTAGAICLGLSYAKTDTLLIMNGDSFCHFNLLDFFQWHFRQRYHATMLLKEVTDCNRYGRVKLANNNRIDSFKEKESKDNSGLINAGAYLIRRNFFDEFCRFAPASLEKDLFPILLKKGFYGWVASGAFIDIGTPESFQSASAFFNKTLDFDLRSCT